MRRRSQPLVIWTTRYRHSTETFHDPDKAKEYVRKRPGARLFQVVNGIPKEVKLDG